MKIAPPQLASFLANPPAAIQVFLFYGPDAGQVQARSIALAKKFAPDLHDAFRVALLSGEQIAAAPARLIDEMAALALGGGQRLVWVRDAGENIGKAVAELLAHLPATDTRLIISAGELGPRDKLRSLAEGHAQAAALACYVAEGAERQKLIRDFVAVHNLQMTPDALAKLGEVLPADQLGLQQEIDKLALYAHGQSAITLDDVQNLLADTADAELDDFVFCWAAGEVQAYTLASKLKDEGVASVMVLRALQRHTMKMLEAKKLLATGIDFKSMTKALRPPLFWKLEGRFAAQLKMWEISQLLALLARLVALEAAAKTSASDNVWLDMLNLTLLKAGKAA